MTSGVNDAMDSIGGSPAGRHVEERCLVRVEVVLRPGHDAVVVRTVGVLGLSDRSQIECVQDVLRVPSEGDEALGLRVDGRGAEGVLDADGESVRTLDVVDVPESEEHETSAVTAIAAAPRAVKPRTEVFMKGSLTY